MPAEESVIIPGDCREAMREMQPCIFDAIVTDPPYGLEFMGKGWDRGVPGPEFWQEALRVLKPGGALLAFGGTRTWHRLAVAIEDAGFEIRDSLMWLYGSGFPKSLDVSKAIDKALGAERERVTPRSVIGHQRNIGNRRPYMDDPNHTTVSDIPASASASAWQGYGTALKPAWEPIILARKPLDGTVAANVLEWGCGGINVDGCRIEADGGSPAAARRATARKTGNESAAEAQAAGKMHNRSRPEVYAAERAGEALGRWPANLLLDEEAAAALDEQTGDLGRSSGTEVAGEAHPNGIYGSRNKEGRGQIGFGDSGGASRFFYCAKASSKDRNYGLGDGETNPHPTVKPISLMRWLCRLVTPPGGGLILDPFLGSGSTGIAAVLEGNTFVGCEQDMGYVELAAKRIGAAEKEARPE